MADSLRSKTLHALSWSFLESVGLQGVRFIIGIVLARLLFPEQFGLIGMLMIFMALAQSFLDSGFGAALIQKRDVTQLDTCSIFYFNIVVGLAAAGLLCLVAPWIAAFYKQPILTPLTRALSLEIVINSFGLIQGVIFTKQLNFKILTKVSLIASTLSGLLGVALATVGFGVWSLVVQQVSRALFRTICLWFFSSWRPAMIFSFSALRKMFGFGSRLLFSDLLNRLFDNIYLLVIGKLFSATDLGFFTRAKTFQEIPQNTLAGIVGRVTFPVFSSIQDDPARLKKGLKKALTVLVLVNFPMMIGLAVVARPLVLVMLTEKWAPCIPYLQLFCVAGVLYSLHVINLNLLMALGRSDLFLRLEIIKKALIVINIAVTWRWGISAMIYGMIAMSLIAYYLNSYYAGVLIGYSIWEQMRDVFSYLIMAVLMGIAIYAAGLLPFPNHWIMLVVQIPIGIVLYVCICRLFRLTAFMELWQVVWKRIPFSRDGTAR
ncbi:MAG: MOP flippase family protein [Candidatus Aminicenantales bacterium]